MSVRRACVGTLRESAKRPGGTFWSRGIGLQGNPMERNPVGRASRLGLHLCCRAACIERVAFANYVCFRFPGVGQPYFMLQRIIMVGVAQLVRAPDCGSGGREFESLHPPHSTVRAPFGARRSFISRTKGKTGVSPSGKAQDFDSCIPLVRIQLPQPPD